MPVVFNSLAWIFDGLMKGLSWIHPLAGITGVCALTAVLVLIIYKYLSNQAAIRTTKARIKADFLAITLYKDSVRVLFSSAGSILWTNLKYVGLNGVPLLFMILPVSILMANLEAWHGNRPLRPGEKALVKVRFDPSLDLLKPDIQLRVPEGLHLAPRPVRMPAEHEIDWRVEAKKPGSYQLKLQVGLREIEKSLAAGAGTRRLSVMRHRGGLWEWFLYSGEPAIPGNSPVESISVSYPSGQLDVGGWKMHWMWYYFVVTLVLALALKGVFRVTL